MPSPDQAIWLDVLSFLRNHHPDMCRQWFEEIKPVGLADGVFNVRVNHEVHQRYLQRQCGPRFTEAIQAVTGRLVSIRFLGPEGGSAAAPGASAPNGAATHQPSYHNGKHNGSAGHESLVIVPDFTFEHFIVGPENRLAHAAALAVARQPGRSYNPLFIHGGVGLGKTHLLQAICLRLMENDPGVRIHYTSCESFATYMMQAVQDGQLAEFRHRFQDIDTLVIDDIHFLAKRDRSQEEFFHVFNALQPAGRQIVLSSDAAPQDIPTLESRLVSRFQSGLVVEVGPPCYETRVQIVKQKAALRGLDLPEDVACLIAGRPASNVRELEGAVTRVQMQHLADNAPITLHLAITALGESHFTSQRVEVSIQTIIDVVVDHYTVKVTDLQSKRRQKSIALPRQVCMYLARRFTRFSLEEIGGYFGGRDHTTVMHAVRTIQERRDVDPGLDRTLTSLEARVRPPGP